ncbi:MAG: hypothetical protein N2449_00015 [Bacteroidales bacterium]|nr:hypothetical protein [Bacteroidales bacterium]
MKTQSVFKKWIYFLVLLLIFSCQSEKPIKDYPNVLIMVDFTYSVSDAFQHYEENLIKIVNKLPEGSRIIIGKIKETTEATFVPLIDATFPTLNYLTDNELDFKDKTDSIRNYIISTMKEEFENPTIHRSTNVLSSLNLAKELFPGAKNIYLILMSDMLHNSIDFSLEKSKINEKFIDKTINMLKEKEKLPDLSNVKIYVVGARAEYDDRYSQIKKFWMRVFKETNAQVLSYGHSLVNIDIK